MSRRRPTVLSTTKLALFKRETAEKEPDDLAPRPRTGRIPLSPAQRRLWFVWRLDPRDTSYNEQVALQLTGPLDVDALGAALSTVVERHEPLRTTFSESDGIPEQIVRDASSVRLSIV